MKLFTTIAVFALVFVSCGGGSGIDYPDDVPTSAPPFVSRVEPTSGAVGDEITIFGFGFSSVPPTNIVIIGDSATTATEYMLLDTPTGTEIESITANVPDDATAGEQGIVVLVYENPSNGDITFTVTP